SSGSDIGGGPRSRCFVGCGCVRQHYVHLCALPHRIVFLGCTPWLLGASCSCPLLAGGACGGVGGRTFWFGLWWVGHDVGMKSSAVVERFGMGSDLHAWWPCAERFPPPVSALQLPAGGRAAAVLDVFALCGHDGADVVRRWAGSAVSGRGGVVVEWSFELWHLEDGMYRMLCADVKLPRGEY